MGKLVQTFLNTPDLITILAIIEANSFWDMIPWMWRKLNKRGVLHV